MNFINIKTGQIADMADNAGDSDWRPFIQEEKPSHDPIRQQVVDGPIIIDDDRVRQTWHVIAAPSRRQSTGVVRRRLTDQEKAALHSARAASWQIDSFVSLADSEGVIDESDPDFSRAVAALDAGGIILEARWDALLAP